jgi:hypothetical protein
MDSIVSKIGTEEILALSGMAVGVIAILGGITVAITQVVSSHRRRMQLDEMDATLKMEMIQRGMAADEIATVLKARSSSSKSVNLNLNGMKYGCNKRPGFAKQHENA